MKLLVFITTHFRLKKLMIHDLHSSSVRLCKGVLVKFLPIATINQYSTVTDVPYDDIEQHLSDLDMNIGTQTRVHLTELEKEVNGVEIEQFYR